MRNHQNYYLIISKLFGWGIVGFFFPIIGFVLFMVWKEDHYYRARSVGIGALFGILIRLLGFLFYGLYIVSKVT